MYIIDQEISLRVVRPQEKPGDAFVVDVRVGRYQSLFSILAGSNEDQGRQIGLAIAHLMQEQNAIKG